MTVKEDVIQFLLSRIFDCEQRLADINHKRRHFLVQRATNVFVDRLKEREVLTQYTAATAYVDEAKAFLRQLTQAAELFE